LSEFLTFFVHQPLRLLMISGAFLVAWVLLRNRQVLASRSRPLLIPAAYFAAFSAWEWLVMTRTPDADIRVDLLLLWPLALLIVGWSLYRTLRGMYRTR
jgi:hypothetical protein